MEHGLRDLQLLNGIFLESSAIALLIYILFRQGRHLSDIGFIFRVNDLWHSTLLAVLCALVSVLAYFCYGYLYYFIIGSPIGNTRPQTIIDGPVNILIFIFIFINPFFEELIVRAFTITEIEFLTNSTINAVIFSVFIQTIYHLYQGLSNAIALSGAFLLLSIYYVKFRRIVPVILVHGYMDTLSLVSFIISKS